MNFLTANSLSEDGFLQYYKDIDTGEVPAYTNFVADGSGVSTLGGLASETLGGRNRWVDEMCPIDWDVTHVSSEIDWMRFFWYILTHEGDGPTFRQILEWFNFANDSPSFYVLDKSDVYIPLLWAAEDSDMEPFLNRIEAANCAHGAFHGGTCN